MTSMDLSKSTEQKSNAIPTKLTNARMAFNYGLNKFKSNKKILIVITILHLIAVPLVMLSLMINIGVKGDDSPNEMLTIIGICSTAVAGLAGIVVAIGNYDYYYRKSSVDMTLSLPITFKARFLSDFITGIVTYIAPFIATQILSTIMFGIGHLAFDGKLNIIINRYAENEIPQYRMCTIFSEIFPFYIKLALGGILVMLFLYTLTVFVVTCCGNVFEAGLYTIFLNGLIPATIAVFCYTLFNDIYGINVDDIATKLLNWSSPGGSAFGLINIVTNGEVFNTQTSPFWGWILPVILSIAVLFFLCYFLGKYRKAEDVGKPFVFKTFYYIMISIITFCIGCLYLYTVDSDYSGFFEVIIPFIVITAVTYLIFEVVTNRGFKKFWMSAIRYAVTAVCVGGLYVLITTTGGLGAETRVPDVNSVSSVSIDYTGYFDNNVNKRYYYYDVNNLSINLKDKENIITVIDAHQKRVDKFEADGAFFNNYCAKYGNTLYPGSRTEADLKITYKLKSGMTMTREYENLDISELDILKNLDFAPEYRNQIIDTIIKDAKDGFKQSVTYYNDQINNHELYPSEEYTGLNVNIGLSNYYATYCELKNVNRYDEVFFNKFIDAYEKDLKAETEEQYFYTKERNFGKITIAYCDFYIRPYYKNTIALISQYTDFSLVSETDLTDKRYTPDIYVFSYDDYTKMTGLTTVTSALNNIGSSNNQKHIEAFNDDEKALINVSTNQYITSYKCYTITVNGETRIIPPEYTSLAEKVYNSIEVTNSDEYYDDYYYGTDYNYYD